MRHLRLRRALAATAATALLAGCSTSTTADLTTTSADSSTSSVAVSDATTVTDALSGNVEVETGDTSYDESEVVDVTLSGGAAETDSEAVSSEDGTVTINAPGTYRLSGELDGQLVVDSAGDGVVRLVLDDVSISSESTSAVNVVGAESVTVVLAEGSTNTLTDATSYADTSEDAPTAALHSTADLTIGGTGALAVTGNTNNGIVGKDGLVITGGTIEVTSVDDGIIGKDYLAISGGDIAVDAVDDGIKSDNTTDPGSGFVLVEGGSVEVSSQDDGIKGVQVLVAGGTIDVAGSTEAMEGSLIIIDGGDIELHSADDGVNVATSDDSASTDGSGGPPDAGGGGGSMATDDSLNLVVNGGTLEVWASGDGLDSNGNAVIAGGDITVYGPTSDGNGAVDVNGTFDVSGGTLLATGSAGMMVAPSPDSPQAWVSTALPGAAAAGSEVVITAADGTQIASYTVEKDFASVTFSSADLEHGATYTVTVDGTDTEVTAGEAPAGSHGPMGG
ncbi:carbohydrate-binding domain-containing protein [Nocardioides abyssi]|uniref:Carbohydrate-binding domain-containing protein n=1 Tax=Nocardioides abyssi TaxID=3058370 RepID=A0ABT8EXW4_9ACTN|nr:carbohydrate-binding domain-containing protein [Nocardioides abyssi]MDN4162980.1 carbohydrate-binding domain-containing protein [Nocardioides abyssi]